MDAWVHMHLNVVACIYNANDSIPLAVPGSRAAGGDGVVGSEPLPLAVPGSRAADGEGRHGGKVEEDAKRSSLGI